MIKLRYKLSLFTILSKLIFGLAFLILMPLILERINILQTDNELIDKREQVIDLIAQWGVDYLLYDSPGDGFGSYNILKEEYISLEKVELVQDWNFIEVTRRQVDEEIIDYRVLNYSFYVDDEMYLLEIGKSLSSIRQTERNIRNFTLVFLLAFLAFSSFMDISFATRLIKPLESITRNLKKTLSPTSYNAPEINTNTTEFVYLNKSLEELMQKIDELFRKEKQTTSNISHELLTPVSIIRGKLENLLVSEELNEEAAAQIEDSLKTLHRLKSMVSSLLLIARVESHQYLKEDQFSINALLEDVAGELHPLAEDKNISIDKKLGPDYPIKNANKPLMFTMFYNIFNNAIKFTPSGGKITISSGMADSNLFVSIKDTGKGMTREEIDNLFTRFKKRTTHNENGTGIGLAISRSIADFHNIHIGVQSQPGQGSEFIFSFRQ